MQHNQNPYIDIQFVPKKATEQHAAVADAFDETILCRLPTKTSVPLPDIVFIANGGLSLPRCKHPLVLLPNMKYPQRKAELPYLKAIFKEIGVRTLQFPGKEPFEGQAELKWFDGGRKAVCGYGFRSTRKTFHELDDFFKHLYAKIPGGPPTLLVLPLISSNYYHLDVAMCEYPDKDGVVTKCMVHRGAFSPDSLRRLKTFLGPANVTVIDTDDTFCLNAVVEWPHLITHTLTDPALKPLFEETTGLRVRQVSTTDFEKSGGSVRCMTLDLYAAFS